MDDATFICELMKTETNALGFIPSPTIRDRFTRGSLYILQRNSAGRRIGYLLHSRPRAGAPMLVHQVCIELGERHLLHATRAVDTLLRRAVRFGSTEIRLRCAADLEANSFWLAVGFLPIGISKGGSSRNRQILHYWRPIPENQHLYKAPEPTFAPKKPPCKPQFARLIGLRIE